MGKKHVIKETAEQVLKESAKVESAVPKETRLETTSRKVTEGRVYISSSFNNTIMTLTDNAGNVIAWASAGSIGFKGARKSTPFAASKVAEFIAQASKKVGIEKLTVLVKGVGSGRESAIRSLAAKGFEILSIADVTPVPHDGTRPPKARRV